MRNSLIRGLAVGLATVTLGLGGLFVAQGSGTSETSGTRELQVIGKSGPDAVPLKVWTDKESGQVFREGDRAIISFQAERTAYLIILAIASDGNVQVLFPNEEIPDNLIQKGKVYTLFGDDSSLRLTAGHKRKNSGLVFYLSEKPLSLTPLKAADDQQYLSIPANARDNIITLKDKLKTISEEPGFNRIFVSLSDIGGENLEAKVSVLPAPTRAEGRKALPGGVQSAPPEVLTGAAGLKTPREEDRQR